MCIRDRCWVQQLQHLNNKLIRIRLQHFRGLPGIAFDQLCKQRPYLRFNFPDSAGFDFLIIHVASLASRHGGDNINCPIDGNILSQRTWKSPLFIDLSLCVFLLSQERVFRLKVGFQLFAAKMATGGTWIR